MLTWFQARKELHKLEQYLFKKYINNYNTYILLLCPHLLSSPYRDDKLSTDL
jgi:hypothetical protein